MIRDSTSSPGGMRHSEYAIEPLLLTRWSPRAMSGDLVSRDTVMRLFEAARWAPSSYNNQPWRFVYVLRDSPRWPDFLSLLVEGNRAWARRAGALVVIVSKTTFDRDGRPSRTHCFDTGAAWQNLALQGVAIGLVVHGMEGFDYARAAQLLAVPAEYEVMAMVAVGYPGDPEQLSERQRHREHPSDRKPLSEIVLEGAFGAQTSRLSPPGSNPASRPA